MVEYVVEYVAVEVMVVKTRRPGRSQFGCSALRANTTASTIAVISSTVMTETIAKNQRRNRAYIGL